MNNDNNVTVTQKRPYETPTLVVRGNIAELTQVDKVLGASDGFTFMGQQIKNAS